MRAIVPFPVRVCRPLWVALPSLCVLAGAQCPEERAPIEPVVVGVLNPLTGGLSSLGPAWEDAARLAAEQVNAAGGVFDGRPLELRFYDSETNAAAARNVANKAVAEGAVAIVGPATSGEAAETRNVVQVPQVSCCATSPALTAQDDWFFRTTPNDLLQGQALAYLATSGRPALSLSPCAEAVTVYRDDPYGQGLDASFQDAYVGQAISGGGVGQMIASHGYPSTDFPVPADYDTMATAATTTVLDNFAANHDPTVDDVCVVLVSFALDGGAMVKALRASFANYQANNQPSLNVQYFGTDGLYDAAFPIAAQASALGVIGTAPTHAENEAYNKFRIAYHARFGSYPTNLTSNMYDAVMLLALAITHARQTGPEAIRTSLFEVSKTGRRFEGAFFGDMAEALLAGEDIDYVGPSGELDFDAAGDVIGDYALWRPTSDGNGGYNFEEPDFLPATEFAP